MFDKILFANFKDIYLMLIITTAIGCRRDGAGKIEFK
jgi:hypothetical protein